MEEEKIYNGGRSSVETQEVPVSGVKPEDVARQYADGFPEDADFNPYSLEEAYVAGYMSVMPIPEEDDEVYERVRILAESYKMKFVNEECSGYVYPFCVSDEDVVIAHLTGQRRAERDAERENTLKEDN